MSIVQALIGSIVSSSSGGGGGGTYPSPGGLNYQSQGASGFSVLGTPYDPGGAVQGIASVTTGWRRVTSSGYWCNVGSVANDNPGIFQTILSETNDAYGGFGDTMGADGFAIEWTGYISDSSAAAYWTIYTDSDDVAMFWIGNAAYNPTAENAYVTSNNGTSYPTNSLLLTDGAWYPIRMRFQEWSGAERCQVYMAAEGGTAYAMLTYWLAGHVLHNGATGGYGSSNSLLLNLGETPYSGSGDWLDESPALNHAEPYGTTTLPTWLSSEAGGVWQLDGTQHFNVPTLPNYKEQTATMSIWFNCAGDNTFSQTLLSKELTFKLRLVSGGAINIMAGNGYTPWIVNSTTAVTINYGTWNHVVVTIDSGATVVYLNGTAIGTYSGATLGTTGDFPFNIGSYSYSSDYFVGKIGQVKFLSGVFTAQDAAGDYAATATRYGITP